MTLRKLMLMMMPLAVLAAQEQKPAEAPKAEEAKQEAKQEEAAPAGEKTWSGWVEVGARWQSDVAGSMDAYRSIVNLSEGFRLPSMDVSYQGASKLMKTMRLTAGNWGDPFNTARLELSDEKYYRYTTRYSNLLYYNFLPSFANPAAPGGFSQRAYDMNMRNFDHELTVLPNERFTPYLRVTRNWSDGRGITPLVVQGNEYALRTNLDWYQQDVTGGIRMNFTRSHLTIEHGSTDFGDSQSIFNTETMKGSRGNVPVLGQLLSLTNGNQVYDVDGSSRITKVLFTANPYDWVDLYGQVLYANPKTVSNFNQTLVGSLYSTAPGLLFYSSGKDTVFGDARRPHTTGSFGMELRPISRLRIRETFETDRIKTDTTGALEATYLKNTALAATLKDSYADRLETSLHRQTVEALYDFSRRFTLRGGYRYEWGDALIRAGSLSITGPQERLELRRHIGLAGFVARPWDKLTLNGSAEVSNGVKTYYRTSLQDYYRLKLNGRYEIRPDLLMTAVYNRMENQNPAAGVNYDFKSQNTSVGLQYMPGGGKWVTLIADYSRSTIQSDIGYLILFPYQQAQSLYRDIAHTGMLLADIALPGSGVFKPRLTFGGSYVTTDGSRPSKFYQPHGKLILPLHKNVHVFSEWRTYGYNQPFTYSYETFRTNMVMTGIKFVL
ncbi:MAG: hypothetical protein IH602_01180 [Bryobacteraceae bacterium]|nr:hypothetical protein [Bryobacteraceae bacterium]